MKMTLFQLALRLIMNKSACSELILKWQVLSIINQQVCTYLIRNITFARANGMKVKTLYAFASEMRLKYKL